jgi:ribosomal protein S4
MSNPLIDVLLHHNLQGKSREQLLLDIQKGGVAVNGIVVYQNYNQTHIKLTDKVHLMGKQIYPPKRHPVLIEFLLDKFNVTGNRNTLVGDILAGEVSVGDLFTRDPGYLLHPGDEVRYKDDLMVYEAPDNSILLTEFLKTATIPPHHVIGRIQLNRISVNNKVVEDLEHRVRPGDVVNLGQVDLDVPPQPTIDEVSTESVTITKEQCPGLKEDWTSAVYESGTFRVQIEGPLEDVVDILEFVNQRNRQHARHELPDHLKRKILNPEGKE